MKSYQAIHILMTKDHEIIPGNIMAIYILMTKDHEIIPGNIHSYDKGT